MCAEEQAPEQRPCGIYRTSEPIGDAVRAGALVYFHNHGDPGPGVYLPREWRNNRAVFHERGTPIPDPRYARSLEPLLPEGFYRVVESFYCCPSRCQHFEAEQLVQLGYNGDAAAILFLPQLVDGAVALPTRGAAVSAEALALLRPLKIAAAGRAPQGGPAALH